MLQDLWQHVLEIITNTRHARSALSLLEKDFTSAWPDIERLFASSRRIYVGPTGASGKMTAQAKVLRKICQSGEAGEQLLFSHINHANPKVAAYCLAGLDFIASSNLLTAAESLIKRKEEIICLSGCLGQKMKLGEMAQQIITQSE